MSAWRMNTGYATFMKTTHNTNEKHVTYHVHSQWYLKTVSACCPVIPVSPSLNVVEDTEFQRRLPFRQLLLIFVDSTQNITPTGRNLKDSVQSKTLSFSRSSFSSSSFRSLLSERVQTVAPFNSVSITVLTTRSNQHLFSYPSAQHPFFSNYSLCRFCLN
jgi:hypothetical protein